MLLGCQSQRSCGQSIGLIKDIPTCQDSPCRASREWPHPWLRESISSHKQVLSRRSYLTGWLMPEKLPVPPAPFGVSCPG